MAVALEARESAPDTSSFLLRYRPGDGEPKVIPGPTAAGVARAEAGLAVFDGHIFDREALARASTQKASRRSSSSARTSNLAPTS